MRLTLKLKDDILALAKLVEDVKIADGGTWSDSYASKQCFNHGEFLLDLRKWDGGKKSPTLEKVAAFESFLRDQISKEAYQQFRAERAAITN